MVERVDSLRRIDIGRPKGDGEQCSIGGDEESRFDRCKEMQNLQFQPFDKQKLIEGLKTTFPQYVIQTSFGSLQVRMGRLSLYGNVLIKNDPKTGKIATHTNSDLAASYIFLPPLAIYLYIKRKQAKAFEDEVVAGLKTILEPAQ